MVESVPTLFLTVILEMVPDPVRLASYLTDPLALALAPGTEISQLCVLPELLLLVQAKPIPAMTMNAKNFFIRLSLIIEITTGTQW